MLCPCFNPVKDFLLVAAPVCLFRLYRRCLRPDKVRRQTLQHRQTPSQNQSLRGAHTGAAVCRRRCFNIPQREGLQHLVDKLFHTCKEFGLTISLRKINILAQGAEFPPVITIDNTELEVVNTFTYLGSTVRCQAQIRLTLRSAAGSPKQLLSWPNSTSECGAMTC